jgi:hypothetical protein
MIVVKISVVDLILFSFLLQADKDVLNISVHLVDTTTVQILMMLTALLKRAYAACPSHKRKVGDEKRECKSLPASTACIRVYMKMTSTLPQAGKWRPKVRSSCTNESTSKPGTPQMDTPGMNTEDTFLTS